MRAARPARRRKRPCRWGSRRRFAQPSSAPRAPHSVPEYSICTSRHGVTGTGGPLSYVSVIAQSSPPGLGPGLRRNSPSPRQRQWAWHGTGQRRGTDSILLVADRLARGSALKRGPGRVGCGPSPRSARGPRRRRPGSPALSPRGKFWQRASGRLGAPARDAEPRRERPRPQPPRL